MFNDNLYLSCIITLLCIVRFERAHSEKFRVCVVDGRGGFKKSGKYCPILDGPDSRVECVLGVDRLDCLRKISKGVADFSVFTPEDLVTATNSEIEVLITNELRFTKDENEYEVVAVVDDASGIKSQHDLRDKRFCHPGYGYETDWTTILSNFLEASVVPQTCDPSLTLSENRIKASSMFFRKACKAGPWVNNPILDKELKQKYPNLCELCDNPNKCAKTDKYWGRRGPLMCLTDQAGDVAWARLDDVKVHFGLVPGGAESTPEGYSLICPDGTSKPLNSTNPCVWVVKPWPVVATKRTSAQDIQEFISTLSHVDSDSWKTALLDLIETYHVDIIKLQSSEAIETFLDRAPGFLSANSFTGCHPPRTIRICTTSIIENAKCSWLRESAAVYGVEPDLECLKAFNTTHCMQALSENAADLVMVPSDLVNKAVRDYNLTTLFYETVNDDQKYITIGIAKAQAGINSLEDLRGKRACFPVYDGIAWNSVIHALHSRNLLNVCPHNVGMADYFGPSCVPNLPLSESNSLKQNCDGNIYDGEFGAIRCLLNGGGDVAFLSQNSLNKFLNDPKENKNNIKMSDLKVLCQRETQPCHYSWAPVGQAMVRENSSNLWIKDTQDVFFQLDNLFGKNFKSLTSPFTMFGPFDGKSNILFRDETVKLRLVPTAKNTDKMTKQYDNILKSIKKCTSDSTSIYIVPYSIIVLCSVFIFLNSKFVYLLN